MQNSPGNTRLASKLHSQACSPDTVWSSSGQIGKSEHAKASQSRRQEAECHPKQNDGGASMVAPRSSSTDMRDGVRTPSDLATMAIAHCCNDHNQLGWRYHDGESLKRANNASTADKHPLERSARKQCSHFQVGIFCPPVEASGILEIKSVAGCGPSLHYKALGSLSLILSPGQPVGELTIGPPCKSP